MSGPDWMLVDARQYATAHRYTFCTPSPGVLEELAVGDAVALWLRARNEDESVGSGPPGVDELDWVIVVSRDASSFLGTFDTTPDPQLGLYWGNELSFGAEHVVDTGLFDPVPSPIEPYMALCLVDDAIVDGSEPVREVFREAPIEENDSGWRIGSGRRGAVLNDSMPARSFVALGEVLEQDDSFVELLDKPVGYRARRVRDGPFAPADEGVF